MLRVLLWVGLLAAVVRLAYFAEHAGSPFFGVPVLDEKYYDTVARAIAEGRGTSTVNPGFRPFLYPLFLAGCYLAGGDAGVAVATAAQHVMGVVTAMLAAALALHLFRRASAGWLAGGLYALAGPPLYFEGELLITSLFTLLVTALLALVAHAERAAAGRFPGAAWLAAGLLIGIAAQARPNALLYLAAFPAAGWALRRAGGTRERMLAAVLALGGTVAVLVAAGWWQQPRVGRFQLVPTSGGINFYLGNRAGADGMVPRQERWVTYGEEYRDSVQVFSAEAYRDQHPPRTGAADDSPDPRAVSRYWWARAMREIGEDPLRWLALMGRKLGYLVWSHEIPNNKSYAFVSGQESALLRWLPVRWWLLLSLAALGSGHAWRHGDRRLLYWIGALVALHSLGILLFFVNSRYRIPIWPAMAVLAAGALPELIDRMRASGRGRSRRVAAAAGLMAFVAVLSLVNWTGARPPGFARDYFFRSIAYLEKNQPAAAIADARRSIELDGSDPAAHFQLGTAALAAGDHAAAYEGFRDAARLAPREPRIYNNLAILHERSGRPADAYRGYRYALELAPDFAPALVNAALLELRAGLLERARDKLYRAQELGFDSVAMLCARAFLAGARGDGGDARRLLAEAAARDPQATARLVEDHGRRLAPAELADP